jgi:acetylornithine deacetylase/succinyl-diaminopimelate desuccinylase-like protein
VFLPLVFASGDLLGDDLAEVTDPHQRVIGAVERLWASAMGASTARSTAAVELSHLIVALLNQGDPARGTTVKWTRIRAGDRPNVIPAEATATADMRCTDPAELERVRV